MDQDSGRIGVSPLPVVMTLTAVTSANLGSVMVVKAFSVVGPAGIAALRCSFAAIILLALSRPSLRGHGPRDWWAVVGFGAAIAAMNSFFNEAIFLMPVGPAVTIEMMGPLVLSVILARRASGLLWAALALMGVVLIRGIGPAGAAWHPLGVAFAACAGTAWACYILLTRATGTMFKTVQALALAQVVAAALTMPRAVIVEGAGTMVNPKVLGWGLVVALLSNTICLGLEMLALRRIPAHIFSLLMAFGPVFGSLLAWLIIDQRLGLLPWLGIGLVVLASMGATFGERHQAGT